MQTEGEVAGMSLPPRLYINTVLIWGQKDERNMAGKRKNFEPRADKSMTIDFHMFSLDVNAFIHAV